MKHRSHKLISTVITCLASATLYSSPSNTQNQSHQAVNKPNSQALSYALTQVCLPQTKGMITIKKTKIHFALPKEERSLVHKKGEGKNCEVTDNNPDNGKHENKKSTVYPDTPLNIICAFPEGESKLYFFRNDGKYVRYDRDNNKADEGFPADICTHWPMLTIDQSHIQAAFRGPNNKHYFFISNGSYLSYDLTSGKPNESHPRAIDDETWPGLANYAKKISAASSWNEEKVYFFLTDGQYILFNLKTHRVEDGYPKLIDNNTWPGLSDYANQITSALSWDNKKLYFFLSNKTYIRYNLVTNKVDDCYPLPINEEKWPGLGFDQ
ncbi:MAG: hemopexin repeat-containing protein [Cellvibrionales bacterium]|nr:hemopexin repeat-containing protein [Cellvibrionales bacterium]